MARLFCDKLKSYKTRYEGKTDYKRKIFIAFEGVKTEPTYFSKVSKYLNSQQKYAVEIFPVKRNKQDGKSHPMHIRDGIIEFYEENKSDFIKKKDQLCILFDIDLHFGSIEEGREAKYNDFLKTLKTKDDVKITPYIMNPCFELWLILQLVTVDKLDLLKVKENKKIGKSTYTKTEYRRINRKYIDVDINERIGNAIKNSKSKLLEHRIDRLWENVGTNLQDLFDYIFDT